MTGIGHAVARVLLFPGDLACDALGVGDEANRDLLRMLINSLAWTLVAIPVVAWSI